MFNWNNSLCAVFIAQFHDVYRVIYRTNREWVIDSPENSLTNARLKAEQCIQALRFNSHCRNKTANIYEVSIAGNLCDAMLNGLHETEKQWQQYIDHAVRILNVRDNVSTASFITDSDTDAFSDTKAPHLLVISNDPQSGEHYIDTIQLGENDSVASMRAVHKIKQGEACLRVDEAASTEHQIQPEQSLQLVAARH